VAFELHPYLEERKSRRRAGKNNSNLIVINEECQLCASIAPPIGCSKCYALLCEECIEYFNGKPVCSCCHDELENPKRLATILMFPGGTA
jgi:formylmethanofuran dehydrogenase subunit E